MKLSIRAWLLLILPFFFNTSGFAGNLSARPVNRLSSGFYLCVRKLDANMNFPRPASIGKSVIKVCSCQILSLQSNNYQQTDIGVFAERSKKGSFPTEIRIAEKTIEKEKKHMKLLFYDKMRVVDQISEATDCKSLYLKLKLKNNLLIIYDILDADIKLN
jgi:hypothetical protein